MLENQQSTSVGYLVACKRLIVVDRLMQSPLSFYFKYFTWEVTFSFSVIFMQCVYTTVEARVIYNEISYERLEQQSP